jgi:hypothetical protein
VCVRILTHTDKNPFFFLATHKTIVAEVVGDGVIQNPAKYGAIFKSFLFQKVEYLAHSS